MVFFPQNLFGDGKLYFPLFPFSVFFSQSSAVASEGVYVPVLSPQDTAGVFPLRAKRAGLQRQHFKQVKTSPLLLHSGLGCNESVTGQTNSSSKSLSVLSGVRAKVHPPGAPVMSPLQAHWQWERRGCSSL